MLRSLDAHADAGQKGTSELIVFLHTPAPGQQHSTTTRCSIIRAPTRTRTSSSSYINMMRTRNRLSLLRSSSPATVDAGNSSLLMSASTMSTRAAHSPETPTDLSTCRAMLSEPPRIPPSPSNTATRLNLLIGAGAGKASAKLPELIQTINSNLNLNLNLKLILSKAASRFVDLHQLSIQFPNILSIHLQDEQHDDQQDQHETTQLLYIELRNWAHLFLVSSMDANTLSKVAHGQHDDLLTSVARCWDVSKPLVFCPSMDVCTYSNPLTLEHLSKLRLLGFHRVDCCIEQLMSSPNYGQGFIVDPKTVVEKLLECLSSPVARDKFLRSPNADENNPAPPNTRQHLLATLTAKQNHFISTHNLLNQDHLLKPNSESYIPTKSHSDATSNRHKLQSLKSRLRSRHALDNAKSIRNLKAFESNGMEVDPADTAQHDIPNHDQFATIAPHEDLFSDPTQQSDVDDQSEALEQSIMLNQQDTTILELFPRKFSSCSTNLRPPVDIGGGRNSSSAAGEGDDNSSSSSSGSTTANHNNIDLAALGLDTSKFLTICQNRELSCYTCAVCKNNYKNRKSMARHLKEQHIQGSIFQCKQCGVSYKRREKLIKHNRERHSLRPQVSL